MTLLSVVKDVCARVGVAVPSQVVPAINANRTMQEMLACANEMAQRIAYDTREWTILRKGEVYTGDGVNAIFLLPADYKRLLLTTNVRRQSSPMMPMRFIHDYDQWIDRRMNNLMDGPGDWMINGSHMIFNPVPALGETIQFSYLDKNCIALNGGGYGDTFVNDADSFRLDERLLKLGMIFDWKQAKGSPYAEDMGTWSDAMAIAMGSDKPAPILIDRLPISAYPRGSTYDWPLSL